MVSVEPNVAVAMRDGVVLRADVYRPEGGGRHPVLVRRTCYGRDRLAIGDPRILAERGYVVVLQDVRGRYGSEGDWPWALAVESQQQEAEDGYDTVEWAASLPGGDGRVATWGHSFDAWSQWRLATLNPPSLAGMSASGMPPGVLDWTRGIFETGRRLQWSYGQAVDAKRRAGWQPAARTAEHANRIWQDVERGKWLWHTPLADIPGHVFGPFTNDLHQYYHDVDRELFDLSRVHPHVTVPVLMFTGWWDRLSRTVDHYTGLRKNGPTRSREAHRLIIGPWGHNPADLTGRFGSDINHGPAAVATHEDMVARFFDYHLKGIDNGLGDEPPVKIFVLGHDDWRYEHEWPLDRTEYTDLYLRSQGSANSVRGDGKLSVTVPATEAADTYTYDPRDPVMSLMAPNAQARPCDQAPLDDRDDILVYRTDALQSPIEVTGTVTVRLWAVTNAVDTDWTAKLIDVRPDGTAINVASGIVRACYRNGYDAQELVEPGTPYEYEIVLTPVSIVFGVGHRVRLDVSSSDFPNFDRNHNTGAPFWSDSQFRVAKQQVLHGREHPSRVILPVIPAASDR